MQVFAFQSLTTRLELDISSLSATISTMQAKHVLSESDFVALVKSCHTTVRNALLVALLDIKKKNKSNSYLCRKMDVEQWVGCDTDTWFEKDGSEAIATLRRNAIDLDSEMQVLCGGGTSPSGDIPSRINWFDCYNPRKEKHIYSYRFEFNNRHSESMPCAIYLRTTDDERDNNLPHLFLYWSDTTRGPMGLTFTNGALESVKYLIGSKSVGKQEFVRWYEMVHMEEYHGW